VARGLPDQRFGCLDFLQEKHRDAEPVAPSGGQRHLPGDHSRAGDGRSSFLREPEAPPTPREDSASPTPGRSPSRERHPRRRRSLASKSRRTGRRNPSRASRGTSGAPWIPGAGIPTPRSSPRDRRGGSGGRPPRGRRLSRPHAIGKEDARTSDPGRRRTMGGETGRHPGRRKYDLRNVIGYYESGSASRGSW